MVRFRLLLKTAKHILIFGFRRFFYYPFLIKINKNKSGVYVFHHIPKCGGTSVYKSLASWFKVIKDYRVGWSNIFFSKYTLSSFKSNLCLAGHFDTENNYLSERYPEIEQLPDVFLFSFIREPLEQRISLYFFLKKNGLKLAIDNDLDTFLFLEENYFAKIFCCDESNYRDKLDRYNYIGVTEELEESFSILARLLNKPALKIGKKNVTRRPKSINVDENLKQEFYSKNSLDLLIYNYCKTKFNKLRNE